MTLTLSFKNILQVADGAEKYSTLKAKMVVTKTYPASTPNNSVHHNSFFKSDNGLNNSSICSIMHPFSSPPDCSTPISKIYNSTSHIIEENNVSLNLVANNESVMEESVLPLCEYKYHRPLSEFNATPVTSLPEKIILNNKNRISGNKRSLPMPESTPTPDSSIPDKKIPKFEGDENFKTPKSFKNRLNTLSEPSKTAFRRLSYEVKTEENRCLADIHSNTPRKSCPPLKKSNHLSPKSCGHPSVLEEELPLTMPVHAIINHKDAPFHIGITRSGPFSLFPESCPQILFVVHYSVSCLQISESFLQLHFRLKKLAFIFLRMLC